MIGTLILMISSLVGCGKIPKENNNEEAKNEDVMVTNPDTTYYTRRGDTLYPCNDAILLCGYNEYRCINTSTEYDEESGKYICIVEFKKIIDK